MYKLIAIDLDGTLLNSYGYVSEKNKETLKKLSQNGIEVVVASGRTKGAIMGIAEEIGATNYIISGNGTILHDNKNDTILFESFLKLDKVLKIIKICEENNIYYTLYTEKNIIAKNLNYNVLYYNYENANKPENKQVKINIIEDIYKYVQNNEINVTKITICDSDENIFNRIMEKFKGIKNINVLDVEHMSRKKIMSGTEEIDISYFYTEITNANVNKWVAITKLMEHLNLTSENVIAFGDNINDKEMVENAGLGIAVGKSFLEAHKIGDMFIDDNNSDDISNVLQKIFDI